jgi:release factor glutamine methyltransferase
MAARTLRDGGIDSPDLDARLLLQVALAVDHSALAAEPARKLEAAETHRLSSLLIRRLAGEPVARIAGCKEFWSLSLELGPATLVPRPETETVVEAALQWAAGAHLAAPRIADLGTGTGALLLAMLSELPLARGVGTDLSLAALIVARRNASRHSLANRSAFVACNFGDALAAPFDLVLSNPPYIPTGDIAALAPEVRDHDPHLALDGGSDGLSAYRQIAADARRLLRAGGVVIVELGAGQADAASAMFRREAYVIDKPARLDLAGIPRVLTACKP